MEPIHYHTQTDSYTIISLSLVSSDCYLDFNHKIIFSHHGRDHYPMLIDKIMAQELGESSYKNKTEKNWWAKFSQLAKNFIQKDANNINQETDKIILFKIQTARISVSDRKSNRTLVTWWNVDCTNCFKNGISRKGMKQKSQKSK